MGKIQALICSKVHRCQSMALSQSEALIAIRSQLKEAEKDFELSQKAYDDMRLEVKSNESLKKKLEEKEKIISELKNRDISKECNCEESLKKHKWNYEELKKKHSEKVKQYTELK